MIVCGADLVYFNKRGDHFLEREREREKYLSSLTAVPTAVKLSCMFYLKWSTTSFYSVQRNTVNKLG